MNNIEQLTHTYTHIGQFLYLAALALGATLLLQPDKMPL